MAAQAGTEAGRSRDLARLLRAALAHHRDEGDGRCPVCGVGELDAAWRDRALEEAARLETDAAAADAADSQLRLALADVHRVVRPVPAVLRDGAAEADIDLGPVATAWSSWAALPARTPETVVDQLVALGRALLDEVGTVVATARRLQAEHDEAWQPVAEQVAWWAGLARVCAAAAPAAASVKAASSWLRDAGHELRADRLRPFSDQSRVIWEQLRQESNVTLGDLTLAGTANRRHVSVDVTVDGYDNDALGVMSQGELRALGLSLFLPRATAAASPFRFVLIDDPVQAMDPAKVDGLARVLATAAQTRQVVVFTHDDRLPESIRRLQLDATVWQVSRRAQSEVDLRLVRDPATRYLDDARAVSMSSELPRDAAGVVVASLCRGAVEAACHERVRATRLGAGETSADVEALLDAAHTTNDLMSLARFGDRDHGGQVLQRLNTVSRAVTDAYQAVRKGAHAGVGRDLGALVADTDALVRRALR